MRCVVASSPLAVFALIEQVRTYRELHLCDCHMSCTRYEHNITFRNRRYLFVTVALFIRVCVSKITQKLWTDLGPSFSIYALNKKKTGQVDSCP